MEFLGNSLGTAGFNDDVWIGLYQNLGAVEYSEPDGGWEWTNGEEVSYTNWNEGQPDGDEEIVGWGTAYSNGWEDIGGNGAYANIIIEIPGCCTYAPEGETCAGCTDPLACNYSPSSTIDDNSCIYPDGCTDPSACNFLPEAQCDDGSCIEPTTWYLDTDGDGLGFDSGDLTGFPFVFESCEDWSDGYTFCCPV